MAGILGWVGWVDQAAATPKFQQALDSLCHGPRFRGRVAHEAGGVSVGLVRRREPPAETWSSLDGRLFVALYGRPLIRTSSWLPVGVRVLAERYLEQGLEGLFDVDGSFTVAIVDHSRKRVFALNDRTGSIPVVFAAGGGGIVFGGEAKAVLPLAGIRPRLNREAVISFLNLGYPVGAQTMFEGVHQLEPGSVLELDLDQSGVKVRRYWDLHFDPQPRMRSGDAVEDLAKAIEEAHRAVLADDPSRFHLLLTGGYDSRAVLGFLGATGEPPAEVFTWGISEDLPGSDPVIARAVSETQGVPFRFLQYGAERFSDEAARWTWVSELSSDNLGNFAAGPDYFERMGVDPDLPVLIGDQMLGPGGFPGNCSQAVENITKVPWGGLRPELGRLMTSVQVQDASQALGAAISEVMSGARDDHPKDLQDYLFFHLYVVRWLHASAYFREPMVSPRRPLLLDPVMAVGKSLPRRLRVDKAVLVRLMRERMPGLAGFPIASAHSLVDWEFEVRTPGPARLFFLGLLEWEAVAGTPIAGLVDQEIFREVVKDYFSETPRPVNRQPSRLPLAMGWRRRLAGVPVVGAGIRAVEPLAKRALGGKSEAGVGPVLRRIALVALLQTMIDEGKFEMASENDCPVILKNGGRNQ